MSEVATRGFSWFPRLHHLIYGFLPEAYFLEAAAAMEAIVRKHGPMEIHLEEMTLFEHANSTHRKIEKDSCRTMFEIRLINS